MSSCQHPHILAIKGVHASGQDMYLVYEYMVNGSLKDHLHPSEMKGPPEVLLKAVFLDWPRRLRIALGTAEGLAYLHEVS